jgi:hypothetical protein
MHREGTGVGAAVGGGRVGMTEAGQQREARHARLVCARVVSMTATPARYPHHLAAARLSRLFAQGQPSPIQEVFTGT